MLTADGKLQLFENFVVDRELPKHKKLQRTADTSEFSSDGDSGQIMTHGEWRASVGLATEDVDLHGAAAAAPEAKRSLRDRVLFWRKGPGDGGTEHESPLSIEQFFASVKNTAEELKAVEERARGYEQATISAKRSGQTALYEKLQFGLTAARNEAQLIGMGLPKYITEERIVAFYKQSKKGLRFDWVRHFLRPIPDEIVAKKARADELHLFDNYAVLHYDPKEKSFAETEADKIAKEARKRDPILFGLMQGRRILYFVGDWVDEVCDLTLDQIADALGREAVGSLDASILSP